MKKLYVFEFSLITIIDLIYLYLLISFYPNLSTIKLDTLGYILTFANMLLGIFQLIPGLYLFLKYIHKGAIHLKIYYTLALATIITFTLNFVLSLDHSIFIINFIYIQIFAWLLAHYFVYILYKLKNQNP